MTAANDWPTEPEPIFGCVLWTGTVNGSGRPVVWRGQQPLSAIREAFAREHLAVTPELVPDHLCRRILCVSLEHLELVTQSENELRKSMRHRLKRTRCRRGHALNEATRLVTPEMGILCRVCAIENARNVAAQPRFWVKP